MRHIKKGAYELVMSRGIANAKPVGAGKVRGMGAGMLEGTAHPLADAAAGGPRIRSGMERAGAAKAPASQQEVRRRQVKLGRSGDSFLWLIADNVDVMPTRQRRSGKRLSLMVIEGGKL